MDCMTMVWVSKDDLINKVASVSDGWVRGFLAAYPSDTRKLGEGKHARRLFRVAKVLECIENGEYFR